MPDFGDGCVCVAVLSNPPQLVNFAVESAGGANRPTWKKEWKKKLFSKWYEIHYAFSGPGFFESEVRRNLWISHCLRYIQLWIVRVWVLFKNISMVIVSKSLHHFSCFKRLNTYQHNAHKTLYTNHERNLLHCSNMLFDYKLHSNAMMALWINVLLCFFALRCSEKKK